MAQCVDVERLRAVISRGYEPEVSREDVERLVRDGLLQTGNTTSMVLTSDQKVALSMSCATVPSSHNEIGDALGKSKKTVGEIIGSGIEALRAELARRQG